MENKLKQLCYEVQFYIKEHKYDYAKHLIEKGMKEFPDSAIPHNLLGILYETQGNRLLAMKHFRAGYELDPTFVPIRDNLEKEEKDTNFEYFQEEKHQKYF